MIETDPPSPTSAVAGRAPTPGSGSTSIGRSAWRNAPIATSTATCAATAIDEERFLAAFRAEIAHRAALAPGRIVRSIFFGGGTPSLMRPQTVQGVIDAIAANWRLDADAEITLEANPTSVEAGRFRGYRAAGVNRLSIGVQALERRRPQGARAPAQRRRGARGGRDSRRRSFRASPSTSSTAGPGRARPPGAPELARALDLAGDHLSLYQLTIEPDTIFERLRDAGKLDASRRGPEPRVVRRDAGAGRSARACRPTKSPITPGRAASAATISSTGATANMPASAPARMDGSSTPQGRFAQATERHPEMWLTQVESEGHGLVENAPLTPRGAGRRIPADGPAARARASIRARYREAERPRAATATRSTSLVEDGFIERGRGGRIRVTPMGAPLLDTVVADVAA